MSDQPNYDDIIKDTFDEFNINDCPGADRRISIDNGVKSVAIGSVTNFNCSPCESMFVMLGIFLACDFGLKYLGYSWVSSVNAQRSTKFVHMKPYPRKDTAYLELPLRRSEAVRDIVNTNQPAFSNAIRILQRLLERRGG